MTIQIPNPGTGNGATGDNEFLFWSKVKDNFSDQSNAASRLVGSSAGNISINSKLWDGFIGSWQGGYAISNEDINTINPYGYWLTKNTNPNAPSANPDNFGVMLTLLANNNGDYGVQMYIGRESGSLSSRTFIRSGGTFTFTAWQHAYNTKNTTVDSNGFIKKASPIIKVFSDKIELNATAETQDVTFVRNSIGDYTVNTVSGLSTDGWYLELPKDLNGNPKVAVTLEETNGVISLKSYKRIFSMDTFTFVPDLDEPLDIPESRWIDLRLNEIETPEILPEV